MEFVQLARRGGGINGFAVALGTFDGVHIGHRRIIAAAKKQSTALGTDTAVLIFSSSPHGAKCILPLCDRLAEFEALGVHLAVVCDFAELKDLSPKRFFSEVLIETLGAKAIFTGYNYRFGAGAAGDADLLRALCAEQGIACGVTPCVELDGAPVSSSRIRALLTAGDVGEANRLLGYTYYLRGEVVHGRQLGRTLGMPTVNQTFGEGCVIPAHGVYYTETEVGDKRFLSVSNVGVRPTVSKDGTVDLETHILDYNGDLYGKTVTVRFLARGRAETAFSDAIALRNAVTQDIAAAREFFGREGRL